MINKKHGVHKCLQSLLFRAFTKETGLDSGAAHKILWGHVGKMCGRHYFIFMTD